jgi:hypothetical protein
MDRYKIFVLNEIINDILGLKKATEEEIFEERDFRMRSQYFDPIEHFPDRIDQLLESLNRVCQNEYFLSLFKLFSLLFRFTSVKEQNYQD